MWLLPRSFQTLTALTPEKRCVSDLPYAACEDFTSVDVGRRLLCFRSKVWVVEGLNLGLTRGMQSRDSCSISPVLFQPVALVQISEKGSRTLETLQTNMKP